ncbi:hypothetical protein RRG08_042452 [Elysia crispata]|uniref:Uncharacterized protein n=1 Tax=Elysia crispata TaxID=231223 RepID=A0AAE0ZC44_9GAST|nr:hypothetical protein RRG08_042452 [Elysia crispata]
MTFSSTPSVKQRKAQTELVRAHNKSRYSSTLILTGSVRAGAVNSSLEALVVEVELGSFTATLLNGFCCPGWEARATLILLFSSLPRCPANTGQRIASRQSDPFSFLANRFLPSCRSGSHQFCGRVSSATGHRPSRISPRLVLEASLGVSGYHWRVQVDNQYDSRYLTLAQYNLIWSS